MAWHDYHLHEFELRDPSTARKATIGMLVEDLDLLDEGPDFPEEEESISEWLSPANNTLRYTYDFGDDWRHEVRLESILPRERGVEYPICLAGARACPPQDCGGLPGYERLLAIIGDAAHEEHASYSEWLGGEFDPEAFRVEEIHFDDPVERWSVAIGGREGLKLPLLHARVKKRLSEKETTERSECLAGAESADENSVRLDMLSLLSYIDGRELRLTQAGNLSLKEVRAINELFVEPEELDHKTGRRIYKLRTEEDARKLRFLRFLSQEAGLTKIRQNKFSLTKKAEGFLKERPLDQLAQLVTVWLTKDNWGRMTGYPELAEPLMYKAYDVAHFVSEMPVMKRVAYGAFEKELLSALGLEITTGRPELAKHFSYIAIAMTILIPLESFGIISLSRAKDKFGDGKIVDLELTNLGRYLLVG